MYKAQYRWEIFPCQVFHDKFYLLACTAKNCYDKFSLPRSLVPELVMSVFGQEKCVRVFGHQGKLHKCTILGPRASRLTLRGPGTEDASVQEILKVHMT